MLSAAVFAVSGCGGFLDTCYNINQTDEINSRNAGSIWSFAYAFYAPLGHGLQSIDYNVFATVSDECQQTSPSSEALYFNRGVINESVNPLFTRYQDCYEGIRAANFFLDYVADGKGEALLALNRDIVTDEYNYKRDVQSLNWFIAEAHIAKAYYYSELIRMFGGVPIVENFDPSTEELVPRSSYDACVEYIVEEIDNWKNSLALNWDEYVDREGRFTYGVALAIKARTLLYAASPLNNPDNDRTRWEEALKAAGDVINSGMYSLAPDYDMFSGEDPLSSPEAIYIVRTYVSSDPEKANYPISTPGGQSGACPTQNIVDAYEYVDTPDERNPYLNRDKRFYSTIVYNGATWNNRTIDISEDGTDSYTATGASKTGYYLKKYLTDNLDLSNSQTAAHQWIHFRYGEILLNYAEAANEAWGPDDGSAVSTGMTARDALNGIRERAGLGEVDLSRYEGDNDQEKMRNAIKAERRVELAFEDHRYWDLLRWKDGDVLKESISGVRYDGSAYTKTTVESRVFSDNMYRYPIPYTEVSKSNGVVTQNPGW